MESESGKDKPNSEILTLALKRNNLEELAKHTGKWVYVEQRSGSIYLAKIGLDGKLENKCAWTFADMAFNVIFSGNSILNFVKSDTISFEILDERTLIDHVKLGSCMIDAYTTQKTIDQPDPNTACPKCKSRYFFAQSVQMEHADEPPDVFVKCFECGHTTRDFGYFGGQN